MKCINFHSFLFLTWSAVAMNNLYAGDPASVKIDQQLWAPMKQAISDKDPRAIIDFYHPEAVYTSISETSSHTIDREGLLKGLQFFFANAEEVWVELQFEKRVDNEENAYQRGLYRITRIVDGKTKTGVAEFSNVLKKVNGQWKILTERNEQKPNLEWSSP